jgi:hypothetical protein
VMITAAQVAVEAGVAVVPDAAAAMFPGGHVDGADGMLELTGEWIAAGRPGPGSYPGGFMPPFAFASSVAFDRDEDDQTLTSVSVLLTLAHLAAPAARRPGR